MLDLQLQQNEKDGYEKDRTNLQLLQLPKIRKKKMAKKADEKKCKDCGSQRLSTKKSLPT